MPCPDELAAGLERVFGRIQRERMADMPLLNPALSVQSVGFRHWQGHCLGILITPWFINLMLLPGEDEDWSGLPLGSTVGHVFPSGSYDFMLGEEADIGHYQMCSLFSPVFEFQDQAAAVATAEAAMQALMDAANRTDPVTRQGELRTIRHGEEGMLTKNTDSCDSRPLAERFSRPMSRRDLLRGTFLTGKE